MQRWRKVIFRLSKARFGNWRFSMRGRFGDGGVRGRGRLEMRSLGMTMGLQERFLAKGLVSPVYLE